MTRIRSALLRAGMLGASLAFAQAAPAAGEIALAHVAPLSGPATREASEYNTGIRVALKAANAAGGIHGKQLVLRNLDDEYKADTALARFREAAASDALAALMTVGSPAMTRLLAEQFPETQKFPVIGVIPGAEPLRTPVNPYVYHVRAGDLEQYRKLAEHATTTGQQRVAVAYADIPFGTAGLNTLESLFRGRSQQIVARVALPLGGKADLPGAVKTLVAAKPDIIYMVIPAQLAGEFLKAYRSGNGGLPAQLATASYGNAETLCQVAGEEATRGVVISQVMPNLGNSAIPVVRRFHEDMAKFGEPGTRPSIFHLEAYVTTRVVLEAIRRAGPTPTRPKLVQALDGLKGYDVGGYTVDFSPTRHTGSNFVDISIVGRGCRLMF
ncbi:ABC transporter substrate-binding protein [Zoogloea sp.]|uniref:ABC transporter substrate-binding protein n=1 Tax=Zoogloea sp. TaxID=49181 RepID=UPI0025E30276|nr:ABC transporter substrate-binding protein [Zoogloea sp.]MCK6392123.1 ABC transporter substrate-binding protein [Zoogloea sp.]